MTLSSCAHRVIRHDYFVNPAEYQMCDLPIYSNVDLAFEGTFLGKIELKGGSMATRCSRAEAIELLTYEGCSLGADYMIVTNERPPDRMSSCYRYEADFYAFNEGSDRAKIATESDLSKTGFPESSKIQKLPFAALIVASCVVVFIVGFTVITVL